MKGLSRSLNNANPQLAPIVKVTIPLQNEQITVAAAGSGVAFGSLVLGGLPQGNIKHVGTVANLQLSTTDSDVSTGWHGDFGVGFAPTADADLGDVLEDSFVPSTTIDADGSTKASLVTRGTSTATEEVIYDNTAGDLEVNLNVLVDAGDFTDAGSAVFLANGFVTISYVVLGDD